ncbi:ethanolamine utilization protein EutS [Anaerotaenia torta]|uniref:BMC domain-containing protein n=1 Tax=Anaerotaenia torta TaxID=433293 RepID=UPI003D1AA595
MEERMSKEEKLRIIQEIVPGKQITLAHVIANPDNSLYGKVGMERREAGGRSAIGIVTMSPGETAIIAGDIALKTSGVSLGDVDRVSGTLLVNGSVADVEASLTAIVEYAEQKLGFTVCQITKT